MMTRKKVRVSEGLFNAFNIRLTSRNVFSEFFIIHTAYESHAQRKERILRDTRRDPTDQRICEF